MPDWMNQSEIPPRMPQVVLKKRIVNVHNAAQVEYLVKWHSQPDHEATWEVAAQFVQQYPDFPITEGLAQL